PACRRASGIELLGRTCSLLCSAPFALACSGSRPAVGQQAARTAAHAQSCPRDAALVTRALRPRLAVDVVSCTPGYFGQAGFAFVAWVGKQTDRAVLHHVIVLGDGTLLADFWRGATYHESRGDELAATKALRAEDLDGD